MTSRQGRTVKSKVGKECKRLSGVLVRAPGLVLKSLPDLERDLRGCSVPEDLGAEEFFALLLHLSSLQIDAAEDRHDMDALRLGVEWAQEVQESELAPAALRARAGYNLSNGILALHKQDLAEFQKAPVTKASMKRAPFELTQRDLLRQTRRLLAEAGHAEDLNPLDRSRALCNLGNVLDESGRWVEAYEAYVDALGEFSANGNAAGNAAELLRRRLASGRGPQGHYAALYNHYAIKAKELRLHTVAIAGDRAAERWDRLPVLEDVGHASHDGDPLDPYQQWIRSHRLALSEAIEGLGSDNPRWDDAMAKSVALKLGEPDPPPIFAAMNVLKAEYLVTRRLAFEGEARLLEHLDGQDPRDTGTYADTLDFAIYGQPSAELILAQRAAIDVLDKISVAANIHFKTGLAPDHVSFRNYWFDQGSGIIRKKIPRSSGRAYPGAAVALAELSYDIHEEGLYSGALAMRNAGTHRLVHINSLEPGGVSSQAINTVGPHELIDGCLETLQVARSAYLYLIDLIAEGQPEEGDQRFLPLPLPLQR
ncbi:LA2681 family HEPN domain-containing protein [Frigoribacterium faeni]|uniref:LA2681 family HEPN domain-containing protein n=1 Tax=Frigoribacterium faeni TaxID=145483 RepID=UPI00241326CD|nr:LA2681 family HEPN domain-containing protein [Frigoribacterium faeni]